MVTAQSLQSTPLPFQQSLPGLCSFTHPHSENPHMPASHHTSRRTGNPFLEAEQELHICLYQDLRCTLELQQVLRPC